MAQMEKLLSRYKKGSAQGTTMQKGEEEEERQATVKKEEDGRSALFLSLIEQSRQPGAV
jgi:hypothetical protein